MNFSFKLKKWWKNINNKILNNLKYQMEKLSEQEKYQSENAILIA